MKRSRIIWIVLIILISNLLTFSLVSNGHVLAGQKYVKISQSEFEEFKSLRAHYEKSERIKSYIKENFLYEVTDEQLQLGALHGIVASLEDPYSSYLSVDEYQMMMEDMDGKFFGVGIIVTGGKDSFITVVSPIDDTPAFRAGIKTDDKILKVDGVEYNSESMDKAISNIRGELGKPVTLTIAREVDGEMSVFDVELVREEIRVETVSYQMLQNNIAYIRVSQFDETTSTDFTHALNQIKEKKAKGVIVDLRNNPGGLLHVCVRMADEFLKDGLIVYTENRQGEREETYSADTKANDIPLVVLVNKGSASASEIFSGAIKDHKRGKIIGEQTFGKGIVQTIMPFPEGDGIKLTVTEYFTPNGTSIHEVGVKPDIIVNLPEDSKGIGPEHLKEDTQLQKAIEVLK